MSNEIIETKRKKSIKLEGKLSIYDVGATRERLIAALKDADFLEIDMTEIQECDTSGLQIICSARKTAEHRGGHMIITGMSKVVEDIILKTGITFELPNQGGGTACQK
jgi:anti-sigma B factor antagonist